MFPATAHDWPTIEQEYVEGTDDVTLKILAAKHGVGEAHLRKHSADYSWGRKRLDFRQDVYDRVRRESVKRHAEMRLKLLDHQVALIAAALAQLYDPITKKLTEKASLQDLDRLLTTYDRILARETGEEAPDIGTRIHIHLDKALAEVGAPEGTAQGLLAIAAGRTKPAKELL